MLTCNFRWTDAISILYRFSYNRTMAKQKNVLKGHEDASKPPFLRDLLDFAAESYMCKLI